MSDVTKLADQRDRLEALLWQKLEWRGPSDPVNEIMAAVDAYASAKAGFLVAAQPHRARPTEPEPEPTPEVTEALAQLEALPATSQRVSPARSAEIIAMGTGKECRACGAVKLYDAFNKDRTRADGYLGKCKKCVKDKRPIQKI